MLKVDRTEPRELHVVDDALEYSSAEIRDIMRSLDEGNRLRAGGSHAQGLVRRLSAFGIVGESGFDWLLDIGFVWGMRYLI